MAYATEALIRAARTAGLAARQWRAKQLREKGLVPIETKLDGSIVTEADTLAQDIIRATVMRVDSRAEFVGEEGAASKSTLGAFLPGTRLFVVDPIDGTRSFAGLKPTWSVSVAFAEIDIGRTLKLIAAIVYAPDKDELYYADESGAAIENGGKRESLCVPAARPDIRPVMTFYCKPIADDTAETELRRKAMQYAAEDPRFEKDPNKGSPALSLAAAAKVTNNIVVTRERDPFQHVTAGAVALWDTLAGRYIYRQAGGKFPSETDRHGNISVVSTLTISVMAPSAEMAEAAVTWLTK